MGKRRSVLALLALLAGACEAEDGASIDRSAPGASCVAETPDAAAALCGASLACVEERCVAPQGTPCTTDAACGLEGTCFAEEAVCRYDLARECPDPKWLVPDVCVDWDPQECPCYAGVIEFHERELDGRLSCAGIADPFPNPLRLRQTGCRIDAPGELSGAIVGFGEIKLRIAGISNDGTCSALAEPWIEREGDEGRPAVRITCSATCKFWMERFLPSIVEVAVPTGTFWMGTPAAAQPAGVMDEAPEHPVETSCFFMDRTEVSRQEYEECLDEGVCEPPDYESAGQDQALFFAPENARLPMTSVVHRLAEQYCRYRGKALPSEAEWERAARGEAQGMTTFPWGEQAPDCTRANLAGCGDAARPTTEGVGASHYGVYDLAGDVREWTRDFYVPRAYEERSLEAPNRNPETIEPGIDGPLRVVRGGSFLTPADGRALQVSARDAAQEDSSAPDLGFRCVRYGTRSP